MRKQIEIASSGGGDEENEDLGQAQISPQTQGVDDLLDEIDSLLATDAQAFVEGFVQKGGQ